MTHCVELATDRYGCCVLQKCLAHFEGDQKEHLVSEIASNALLFSQDPFGYIYVLDVFYFELLKPMLLLMMEGKSNALQELCSSICI